jgi:hypothetical protein
VPDDRRLLSHAEVSSFHNLETFEALSPLVLPRERESDGIRAPCYRDLTRADACLCTHPPPSSRVALLLLVPCGRLGFDNGDARNQANAAPALGRVASTLKAVSMALLAGLFHPGAEAATAGATQRRPFTQLQRRRR